MLCLIALLIACSGDGHVDSAAPLPLESLPGVYAGIFPCADCPGIPTTLWVRGDGRYFIEQRYPATDAGAAMTTHGLGRWYWLADDRVMELRGAGPYRRFARVDRDTLDMRTNSELEYRLRRESAVQDFTATIRMAGMIQGSGDNPTFIECLTGLAAPVNRSGDYLRFLLQYKSVVARGQPAYVELDGEFSWAGDGAPRALTIERFVTVRADESC